MSIEPGQIATTEELVGALRALRENSGKSFNQLAAETGIPTATLHDAVSRTGSLPKRTTMIELVLACAQDVRPWVAAFGRAEQAQKVGRPASAADLRTENEGLRALNQQLQEELDRTSRSLAEAQDQVRTLAQDLDRHKGELQLALARVAQLTDDQTGLAILSSIKQPVFEAFTYWQRPAGTKVRYYKASDVSNLMRQLADASSQGVAQLLHRLAFAAPPGLAGDHAGIPAHQVDDYLAAVREALSRHFN